MRRVSDGQLDLSSYSSTVTSASYILSVVTDGSMPPGQPWPASDVQAFLTWTTRGCPEGTPIELGPTPEQERELFYKLLHVDDNLSFLPTAQAYARQYVAYVRQLQVAIDASTDSADALSQSFPYTRDAFVARLDAVYAANLADAAAYAAHPELDPRYTSRSALVQWLVQWAPFGQMDGSWLRNIARGGPLDPVRSALFAIWMDETGDGDPTKNHCNMYVELMRSLQVQLPDTSSLDFTRWSFVPRAFRAAAFELVMGTFPDTFFPELLGMTVQLEWTINLYRNNALASKHHSVDATYWTMHVAIDNAVHGHGALAKQAVIQQMELLTAQGLSEEALQAYWQRIWTGYVGFERIGAAFDAEMQAALTTPPNLTDSVVSMIMSKAQYASQNHPGVMLGGQALNELFATPTQLLPLLVQEGFIVPGKPEQSPFLDLMTFHGPMLRVFSDDEQALWADYIRSLGTPTEAAAAASSSGNGSVAEQAAQLVRRVQASATVADGAKRHIGRVTRHGAFLV